MKTADVPKSGRHSDAVFYMRDSRQCERKHVIPANLPISAQRRAPGAVTAAATADGNLLTDEQEAA